MLNNFIYYSDHPVLTKEFCNEVIEHHKQSPDKHKGVVGQGAIAAPDDKDARTNVKLKSSIDINFFHPHEYYTKLTTVLSEQLEVYTKLLEDTAPLYFNFKGRSRIPPINVQETTPTDYFNWHHDSSQEFLPMFNKMTFRAFTFIYYLNTIDRGGYTEFIDGQQIQPKQGHILIFPATWTFIHRGVPPINQTKYIATGWGHQEMYNYNDVINAVDGKTGELKPENMVEFTTDVLQSALQDTHE